MNCKLFSKNNTLKKTGKLLGFAISFFLFSTIFYFVLTFTEKIPDDWTVFHISVILIGVLIVSYIIKKILR